MKDVNQHLCVNAYGTTLLKRSTSVDSDQVRILQGFAALHLESQPLGMCSSRIDMLVQSGVEDMPPHVFESIDEAWYPLNKLIHTILIISRRFSCIASVENQYRVSVPEIQEQVRDSLRAWLRTYKATNFRETGTVGQSGYTVLLSHYEMAFIMCEHIGCTSEFGYASYSSTFITTLKISINIWRSLPSLSPAQSVSIGDTLAASLLFTALNCRVLRLRLQAARLLGVIPGSQGVWSCTSLAKIATEVIALEKIGCSDSSKAEDDFTLTEIPTLGAVGCVPTLNTTLIHEVRVGSWDASPDWLILRCEQWTDDSELRIFHHYIRKSR